AVDRRPQYLAADRGHGPEVKLKPILAIMRIADRLARREPTFSFEFFPPRTPEAVERLYTTARELKELGPTFVSVTYGAGGRGRPASTCRSSRASCRSPTSRRSTALRRCVARRSRRHCAISSIG